MTQPKIRRRVHCDLDLHNYHLLITVADRLNLKSISDALNLIMASSPFNDKSNPAK